MNRRARGVSPPEPPHYESHRTFLDVGQMYLRILYELEEESDPAPRIATVMRRVGTSEPVVKQHLDRLIDEGLVVRGADRGHTLTERGRQSATVVVRKHRLAESFLVDVVGLEWEAAHIEASRWQHVLGERAETKIVRRLLEPACSPFGCPIPSMDAPHTPHSDPAPTTTLLPLSEVLGPAPTTVTVRRIPERLQTDLTMLTILREIGARPGAEVRASFDDADHDTILLVGENGEFAMPAASVGALVVEREQPD